MAKKSVNYRNIRRKKMVEQYATKRQALKTEIAQLIVQADKADGDERSALLSKQYKSQRKLQQLPRDASPTRVVNRCSITGRSRGVYRRVGLSRIKFRELAMLGLIPGVVKSSW